MFSESPAALAKLQELRAAFVASLPQRMTAINALWLAIQQQGGCNGDIAELHRAAHSLAGAAGAFGQHEIGAIARELETALHQSLSGGDTQAIEAQLHRLEHAVRALANRA
jgi:HPt (histidine-containing phosphotransfer) domain-containing protein